MVDAITMAIEVYYKEEFVFSIFSYYSEAGEVSNYCNSYDNYSYITLNI